MTSALLGYNGFVGTNLANAEQFDLLINRANLESLTGSHLERVVCAALPAAKWIANLRPEEDLDNIRRIEATQNTIHAETFVLISTIDVYPLTTGADETYDCGQKFNHAYGKHRLEFERFVRRRFPNAYIVRLPALFGSGLKKNVIYDLLHEHRLERINPASRFQWYPLSRLSQDLRTIERHGLRLVNVFTEPVETRAILEQMFPEKIAGQLPDPLVHYDLRTRHGAIFGGDSRYVMDASTVMTALSDFIRKERSSQ